MADIRTRTSPDGTKVHQVRFKDNSNKSGYGYKSFTRAGAAKAFEAQKTLEEENQPLELIKKLPVPEAIDLWLDICEKIGRDGREPIEAATVLEYSRRANLLKKYHWSKNFCDLTQHDIVLLRTWLLENTTRDLARKTLSSFHSVVIEMKLQNYISQDVAAGITIKSNGRYEDKEEVDIPSDQEVKNILGAADLMGKENSFMEIAWARYRPMIYLPVFSGIRISENRGIPWFNITERSIKITQRADRFGIIGPVKSRKARRTIELSTKVTEPIFEWKERCQPEEKDLVFPTRSGRPILYNNFYLDAWLPLMKEADLMVEKDLRGVTKLRPKYTPHSLRHYYASKLIENGKDLKYIQSRLGHASLEMTTNTYGHLMKDREEEHQKTADELADQLL